MAKGVVSDSVAVTGRPHIFAMALSSSSVASQQGRTSYRARSPPVLIVRTLQLRKHFAAPSPRRLPNSNFGWPTFSSSELRNRAVCSATYGSTNGNGRPGSGVQKPGDGYNSEFLTKDREHSKSQSPYSQDDPKMEKPSQTPATRRGEAFGLRSGDALQKSRSEKQGDDPYRELEDGQKVYLDELDVITLLEPPPFLRPLQSVYYNHAVFLWKKIGDIPEERRHRLLDLLLPRMRSRVGILVAFDSQFRYFVHVVDKSDRHITKMWELSKLRYEDPDACAETAADMLPRPHVSDQGKPMVWDGRIIRVPWYLKMFSRFQKVFFLGDEDKVYGRVITGGKFLSIFSDRLAPLYFEVMQADCVMATEEPCDIVLEYGDGHLHLRNSIPPGFAKPAKHLPPFNDKACDYLRAVGPGVMVGQAWVEGRKLEQFPRQLFGEFIMVQRFQ